MTDPPPEACVTCDAGPVEKLLFPVAVHFKGSGFYSTDYGSRRARSKDGDSPSAEKASDKPAEKSSADTKSKPASGDS
jgi:predicted nucleic acid-binding Zn ribbon protein